MPRECMFLCLCMCRYGYEKNERKQSKTDKNEHEIGKRSKAEPGKQNDKEKFKLSSEILSQSSKFIIGPWLKFGEFGEFSPCNFREITQMVPWNNVQRMIKVNPQLSEKVNKSPWKYFG